MCVEPFLVWSVLHAESPAITEQRAAVVVSVMKAALAKDGLPSLSVAVGHKGSVWSAAAGAADLENAVPATSQTLYRTASISKSHQRPEACGCLALVAIFIVTCYGKLWHQESA